MSNLIEKGKWEEVKQDKPALGTVVDVVALIVAHCETKEQALVALEGARKVIVAEDCVFARIIESSDDDDWYERKVINGNPRWYQRGSSKDRRENSSGDNTSRQG